ncbi:MAG: type IV toxin-antitoxin system AbiEi family antitoxin [Pseudanabaena sp. ELA607]
MRPKNPLFQKCIAYLESLPNINVEAKIQHEPYFSSEVLADGELIISTSNKMANYICEIKTGITNDIVEQVAEYFANLGSRLNGKQRPLLVTRNLSSLVIDQLLKRNIEFVDVDGNIYLNNADIYITVRNQTSKNTTNQSLEITAAALQVMYALLVHQDIPISNNFDEEISDISGVTLKTVNITLKKLQELDYIRRKKEGYEIIDYTKFLERWELGYAERLRAKLLIGTYSPSAGRNFSEIESDLREYAGVCGYLIGGELGSSIITKYLRPITATLHLKQNVKPSQALVRTLIRLKLKPNPDGNIVLINSFGNDKYQQGKYGLLKKDIAHQLLIHAELVRSGDSRLKETAQLVFDKYIEEMAQR